MKPMNRSDCRPRQSVKRILSILLSLSILLTITAGLDFSAYADTLVSTGKCGANLTYVYNKSTHTAIISGTGDMYSYNYLNDTNQLWLEYSQEIEKVIIESGVTSIGQNAFAQCDSLTTVVIPNTVTKIGPYAFYRSDSINNVVIPSSVKTICNQAFEWCKSLTDLTLNEGLVTIESDAFWTCPIKNLVLPSTVRTIGSYAFAHNDFESVVIPDKVESVGNNAFYDSPSLTDVTMPVQLITNDTLFNGCNIKKITFTRGSGKLYDDSIFNFNNNPEYDTASLWYYTNIKDTLEEVVFDFDDMTDFPPYFFYEYSALKSVRLPANIRWIWKYAFYGCSSLVDINITNNLENICDYAFAGCSSLESFPLPSNFGYLGSLNKGAFKGCSSLKKLVIPDTTTKLYSYVLTDCSGLKELSLPCSIDLSVDVANGCNGIETLTLTKGNGKMHDFTTLNGDAYAYFNTPWYKSSASLKNIVFEDGVTYIGERSFSYCSNLENVTIPKSVTAIGENAFNYCYGIKNVYYDGTKSDWDKISISANNTYLANATIFYSDGTNSKMEYGSCGDNATYRYDPVSGELLISGTGDMSAFNSSTNIPWRTKKDNIKSVVISSGITSVSPYAFYNCIYLSDVSIADSVTSIGKQAFYQCYSLENITFPKSLKSIGDEAFSSCERLGNFTLPNGLESIGEMAFRSCHRITSVTMPNTVKHLGRYAFTDCTELENITLSENLEDISMLTFAGCPKLTQVTLPFSVKALNNYAFLNCPEMKVKILNPVCSIVDNANTLVVKKIIGYDNSTAEAYAKKYNIEFESLGMYPCKAHDYVVSAAAVAPTCLQVGYTEQKTCTMCGKIIGRAEVAKLAHTIVYDRAIDPNCTETGLTQGRHCSACGTVLTEQTIIPATGHTEVVDNAVVPNCTETGLTQGSHCSVCDTVLVPQNIVPALGHKYSKAVIFPTCIDDGYTTYTCAVCSYSYAIDYVDAKGHKPVIDKAVAPTCTAAGLTEGSHCSVCNAIIVERNTVDALGHKYIDTVVPPTCTAIGYTYHLCSACGHEYKDEYSERIDHNYIVASDVASTEETRGYTEYKCPSCGDTYCVYKPLAEHTHIWRDDVSVPATCTKNGREAGRTCTKCGETDGYAVILATGHTEAIDKAVEPTCTETGLTQGSHCSVCNTVLVPQTIIKADGHSIVTIDAVEPTCTESGLSEGKYCDVCDTVLVSQTTIEPNGHSIAIIDAVESTCTETGLSEGKYCDVCDIILEEPKVTPMLDHDMRVIAPTIPASCVDYGTTEKKMCNNCYLTTGGDIIPPLEHSYIDIVFSATCTDRGYTNHFCNRCGDEYNDTYTNSLEHSYYVSEDVDSTEYEQGYTEYVCSYCDDVYYIYKPFAQHVHAWRNDASVSPTCTEFGTQSGRTCTKCGEEEGYAVIPATGHTEVIDKAVEPTCTTIGLTEGIHCSVCDEVIVAQSYIKANGHTEVIDKAVAPTCTESGLTQGRHCAVCDTVFVAQTYVKPNGHTEVVDKAVAPTCTATGLTEGKHCSICNAVIVKQESVPFTLHDMRTVSSAVAPTCVKSGTTEKQKCNNCDYTTGGEIIAPIGHKYDATVIAPSCTQKGYTEYLCLNCGDEYSDSFQKALGHTEVIDKGTPATCTATGLTDGKHCSVCKTVLVQRKTIGKTAHTVVVDKSVPATYAKAGKTEGSHCSVCKAVIIQQTAIAKLKVPTATISKLTATKKGFKAQWKKNTKVTGYQIRYSTKSNMSGSKTVTISKNSTTSKLVSKLSAKKKYYVQIRTYKTVSGKKYYSSWSKSKAVTTKK